jgi:hypothetical protein
MGGSITVDAVHHGLPSDFIVNRCEAEEQQHASTG